MKSLDVKVLDVITEAFEERVIEEFLEWHGEYAEEESIRNACKVLLPWMQALAAEENQDGLGESTQTQN